MPNHTKISIDDIEDSAGGIDAQDRQEARFATGPLGLLGVGLAVHRLKPGKRQSFGHRHDKAEEVCLILSGSGRVRLEDEIVELSARDILRIDPTVARRFEGGPDGMEYIVFGPRTPKDGEILPDFWADTDASA